MSPRQRRMGWGIGRVSLRSHHRSHCLELRCWSPSSRAGEPAATPHLSAASDCIPDAGASRGTARCDLTGGCPSMAIAASPVMRSPPLARCRGGLHDDAPRHEANLTPGLMSPRAGTPHAGSHQAPHPTPRRALRRGSFRPRGPKTSSRSAIFPPRRRPTDSEEPADLTALASRPLPLSRCLPSEDGGAGPADCRALLRRRVRVDPSHC